MSKLVHLELGREPFLKKGDCVVFRADEDEWDGMVISVERRFTQGDIAGQAREVTIAVSADDNPDALEGEWYILENVPFEDIIFRRAKNLFDFEKKEGKVLQFDTVLCKTGPGMV